MGPSVTESLVRSNVTVSSPQLLHSTEGHQPHSASSPSSGDAQRGIDKPEHSFQAEKNSCSSSVASLHHKLKVSSSCDATCGCDDSDPSKHPPHIKQVSQATSSHVSQPQLDHGKKSTSPPSIDPIPTISAGPSEPVERPPVATDCRPVDDDPIYNIGRMKIFDQKRKPIPKLYEARWQVIRPDIFDRVHERLRRGRFAVRLNKPRAPTIVELMSAGITKASSHPSVVVVIPNHIKKMQAFLNTDSTVQNRCKPEDGTTVELLAFACKGFSTLVGLPGEPLPKDIERQSVSDSEYVFDDIEYLDSTDDSDGDSDSSVEPDSTTGVLEVDAQSVSVVREPSKVNENVRHGMAIRLITKDGSRYVRGTCGGLLQLKVPGQAPRLVGLMAGHLLEQLVQDPREDHKDATDRSINIGDIFYPKSSRDIPRYDWALFDAARFGFENYMAEQDSYTIAQEWDLPDVNTAVVIRTSGGEVTGTLSSTTSGVLLNPDQGFLQVRTIMMDKGQLIPVSSIPFRRGTTCHVIQTVTYSWIGSIITKGDSGAWVFQKEYLKIYGYIIATNGYDHAYMVLLHAAIEEMQATLHAVSITLPISTDPGSERRLGTTHERGGQTKRPIPLPILGGYASMQSSMHYSMHSSMQPARLKAFERRQEAPMANTNDGEPEDMISVTSLQEQLAPTIQIQVASQRHKLAKTYLETGRVKEAIKILEDVVQIRRELLGDNHADCLASKHELAVAYIQNRQTTQAITLLEHVVALEVEVLDKSSVERVTSRHELGRAYLADGQAFEAIEILEHVVAVKMSILDESDPQLLASQVVLAEANLRAGRASDAVNLLENIISAAAGTSTEHKNLRAHSRQWLSIARSQLDDMESGVLAVQNSKPLSVFIPTKK